MKEEWGIWEEGGGGGGLRVSNGRQARFFIYRRNIGGFSFWSHAKSALPHPASPMGSPHQGGFFFLTITSDQFYFYIKQRTRSGFILDFLCQGKALIDF